MTIKTNLENENSNETIMDTTDDKPKALKLAVSKDITIEELETLEKKISNEYDILLESLNRKKVLWY